MNKVKFIKEYNESIDKLKEINISDYNLFSKWYVNHPDIDDIVSDDIRTSFFMRYSILMEQSIYENNSDSLLNILIGIIIDIENMNNGDE